LNRFLSSVFSLLAGLLIIASIALTPVAWATPTQTAPAAQTNTAPETSHTLAPPPTNHMIGEHHPRDDLGGSYSLNAPSRPDFWIAAGFTGLIAVAFLITLVLFRPAKPQ